MYMQDPFWNYCISELGGAKIFEHKLIFPACFCKEWELRHFMVFSGSPSRSSRCLPGLLGLLGVLLDLAVSFRSSRCRPGPLRLLGVFLVFLVSPWSISVSPWSSR